MTTDLPTVEAVVKRYGQDERPLFRFHLGYSGWAPGQLEQEVALASWVVAPVDVQEIFSVDSERLWLAALARLGINDPNVLVAPTTSGTAN
jgi:putative transcriptional regulator